MTVCVMCDNGLKQGYGDDESQNKTDKTVIIEFLIIIEHIEKSFSISSS